MIPLILTLSLANPFTIDLSEQDCAAVRAAVVPSESELAWTTVPWRPTFWSAVRDAQAQQKPILLWAMNGHPLACT